MNTPALLKAFWKDCKSAPARRDEDLSHGDHTEPCTFPLFLNPSDANKPTCLTASARP
jgi:hypothetical protein